MSEPVTISSQWAVFEQELCRIDTCEGERRLLKVGFLCGYRVALRHAVREFNTSVEETGRFDQMQARLRSLMTEIDLLDEELRFG